MNKETTSSCQLLNHILSFLRDIHWSLTHTEGDVDVRLTFWENETDRQTDRQRHDQTSRVLTVTTGTDLTNRDTHTNKTHTHTIWRKDRQRNTVVHARASHETRVRFEEIELLTLVLSHPFLFISELTVSSVWLSLLIVATVLPVGVPPLYMT